MIKDSSVKIILKQFKEGNISEEEAVTIIEDLYNKNYYYYPYYYNNTPYWGTGTATYSDTINAKNND